jgi:hypothetical protein
MRFAASPLRRFATTRGAAVLPVAQIHRGQIR